MVTALLFADGRQPVGQIDQPVRHDMHHQTFALHPAFDREHVGREDRSALPLIQVGPHDQIGDAGFVLDGDEGDTLGGAGTLAHQDQARHLDAAAVRMRVRLSACQNPVSR